MSFELLALVNQIARDRGVESLQCLDAEIVDYDPKMGTVIVEFKPYGVRSGDIPLYTGWAGVPDSPSGMQCGPEKGTLCMVVAMDAEWEDLRVLVTAFSEKNKPPGAPAGEWWVVGKTPESYVKLKKDGHTDVGGETTVRLTAPLVELSDSLDALGADDAVVRKADLQKLVDWCNNTLVPWLTGAPYLGNMGAPVIPNPATLPNIATHPAPAATGSSVAKAKGE